MTDEASGLSPLEDPENVDLRLDEDIEDEGPGMTPDEIEQFLDRPVE